MVKPHTRDGLTYPTSKHIYGFLVSLPPNTMQTYGALLSVLKLFTDHNIPIVHFSLSKPQPNGDVEALIFTDLTGLDGVHREVLNRLKQYRSVKQVRTMSPLIQSLAVENRMFAPATLSERVVILRKPVIKAFFKTMREKAGTGYAAILYHIGYEAGREAYESHLKLTGRAEHLLFLCQAFFKQVGMGRLKIDHVDPVRKTATVKIWGSVECGLFKNSGEPQSHFIRGMIAGWFEKYFNTEVTTNETRCIAMGHPYCCYKVQSRLKTGLTST